MNRLGKILQQFAKPEGRSPAEQGTGCLSRLVLEFLNPGDLVFDVGAHIGEKTGSFLAAGATVVCVEPQPKCVEMLRAKYGAEPRVSIEALGIADKPGQLQLSVCSTAPTISTFADSWKHGRFADCQWDQTMMVEVTTLDALVAKYGRPKYCKIDVEGFDLAVLNGLSAPVPYLSFEFTVEFLNLAEKCVARLSSIGLSEFNFMLGEAPQLGLPQWSGPAALFAALKANRDPSLWGDIYARQPRPQLQPRLDAAGQLQHAGLWRSGSPLRLHLGGGEKHLTGYLNLDYPPSAHNLMTVKADAFADVTALAFPAASVDEIRLHHVFEHFNRVTALAMLIRWHRWLKPGGTLRIETPDLAGGAKTFLNHDSLTIKMGFARHMAGDQAAAWGYHLDHWFPERFDRTLRLLGYDRITTTCTTWPDEPYLANVDVTAVKCAERTLEEQLAAADKLLWDSTVAETEKPTCELWKEQLRAVLAGDNLPPPIHAVLPDVSALDGAAKYLGVPAARLPLDEIHNFNQLERDRWIRAKAATVTAGTRVLDVGAGTSPYRSLFAHCDYQALDFKQYDGIKLGNTREYGPIDIESDITAIPLPDNSQDVILCTETLEHVPEPVAALREMARLLKPGGRLLLTAPLGSGLHQLPYHYYGGFTPEWHKHFAARCGLQVIEITPNGGFFRLLAQECARVVWTMPEHQQWHGRNEKFIRSLFGEWLPRYLFGLEEKHFNGQFTVGYHVELVKTDAIS